LDAQNQPIQASAYRLSLHSTATPYSLHPSVDSTGAFRVSHMPYGSFEAVLSIPDAVYLQTINVPAGTTAPFNIAFTETATATAILTGLARDKVESPLEGVVLQLHRRSLSGDLHLVKETKTTALGQYSFTQLPPGSYSLSLLRGGAQLPQLLDLSVQPGTNVVNITSGPTEYVGPKTATAYSGPHTVTGSVRNTADSLVQGAVVWVTPADSETIIVSATTTTAGTYTLSGLADGDYSLYAANHDASGVRHLMLDGPHPLTICGSNIQAPDVVLHAPHAILARIATLDSSGRLAALSGATVTITEVGSSPPETQSTTTDDWGTAVFSTLSQTQYTVTVTKTGFTSRSKTVDLSTLPASPDGFSLLTIDIILVEDS